MLELEKLVTKKTSVRQLRVAELIKTIAAEIIVQRQIDAEVLVNNFITVSKVKISPDLHNAIIFVSIFKAENVKQIIADLNKLAPRFRSIINKNIKLKFSPQVMFRYDDTMEYAAKVDDLLASLKDEE